MQEALINCGSEGGLSVDLAKYNRKCFALLNAAARRNWRKRPLSSCRLNSQCSGDREEEGIIVTWLAGQLLA